MMSPSDAEYNDRYVIQTIIKEMTKNKPFGTNVHQYIARSPKTLILNNADQLSKEAQHCLCRTMEKCYKTCRIIMCCDNASKIISQIRSRCLFVRVPAPTHKDVGTIFQAICTKEKINLPAPLSLRISEFSDRNLRKAILTLEACKLMHNPLNENTQIPVSDLELFVNEIANDILREQTPRQLYSIRGKLYELLIKCVPPRLLISKVTYALLGMLDDKTKHRATKEAARFDLRLQTALKPIFQLEAFVVHLMYYQKKFLNSIGEEL